jgi:outer membrane protein OmpA-like peptidoglycan-associated protein
MKVPFLLLLLLFNCLCNITNAQQPTTEIPLIEDFERDSAWIWSPWLDCSNPNSKLNKGCAHSGNLGLNCIDDCFRRTDLQIGSPSQVLSCWVRFQRNTNAYLGFGIKTSDNKNGYYLCAAPEKGSFDFRKSPDYTFPDLKSVSQTYRLNVWYKMELTFSTQTHVTGKLYSSDGATLLNTISMDLPDLALGGIAFRGNFLHVDEIRAGNKQVISDTHFSPKPGVPMVLKNILFETNSSILLKPSFSELDNLVAYLKRNPTYKIIVSGHTDNIGNEADNKKLSEARAKSVADYLIRSNVNSQNVSYQGKGGSKPITSNETESGRKQNRRVEITISKN